MIRMRIGCCTGRTNTPSVGSLTFFTPLRPQKYLHDENDEDAAAAIADNDGGSGGDDDHMVVIDIMITKERRCQSRR